MAIAVVNGNLYDPVAGTFVGERSVVIEDDLIVDVVDGPPGESLDTVIDARGRYVLPGLIDAHVHLSITTMDFARLAGQSTVEWALQMGRQASATLHRGFTTVRDTGGDVRGLIAAIDRGECEGPRVVAAGRVLSQTGGHGDLRPGVEPPVCGCGISSDWFSHVADGSDAVRKAARHELREGADFLKIMTSGGVASPSDPLDSVQYTGGEVHAAVVEAEHRHTYVTAHAYTPPAIRLAVDHGVVCVEHGNLIDAETAALLASADVTMVPTLVTYQAMAEIGASLGLPARNQEKNEGVFDAGLESVGIATGAGVELGFGTDLLGEAQPWQNRELAIRAELQPPADVLRSMWVTNPRLCRLEGRIGTITPGAFADLVVSEVNPLEDLAGLTEPERNLPVIIKAGSVVARRA